MGGGMCPKFSVSICFIGFLRETHLLWYHNYCLNADGTFTRSSSIILVILFEMVLLLIHL